MDIHNYKHQLQLLSSDLGTFDPSLADTKHQVLNQMFEIVYQSKILDITSLPKIEQDHLKLELFTMLTKHSGTLAFLVIQILAAHNIMNKHNYPKKEYYFQKRCGIAINHLRAPKTIVSGEKVEGGYKLNGTLTWASGYEIFDTLLIGFHSEGQEKEAMASFKPSKGFTIGSADETFVGYGLNTVNIALIDFFVPDEDIVSSNVKGNYTKNKSASKTVHFCIYGLGVAACEAIQDKQIVQKGLQKLHALQEKFISSNDIDTLDNLRIELFNSVHKIVITGMILNGGKSILSSQTLQRIYRELIMFNSNGLNDTLKLLFKQKILSEF